ncbi:hypothetical protein FSP39_008025 [Pinctada imbricata]|uniref:Mitochondrial thiamine pyrophosphate carrier n=1 Tax=Pinctada imbricata TaxID=66713 RepID=A0AA88YRS1_PINIB|nr:hypothetical protein FSP39_008025 [Pinctada imbricata]
MVGFTPDTVQLSSSEHAVAGAVSGGVSRALFQPLDVLKIRFQLQVAPIRKHGPSMYTGIIQATSRIVTEEGVTALWKGHIPAQILSVLYGLVQFTTFEISTKLVWLSCPEEFTTTYRPLTHAMCGAAAGCVSTLAIQPVDVMRTRFISQKHIKVYQNLYTGVRAVLHQEGVRSLYRGLLPAVSITCLSESVVCGFSAGVVSKTIIYPLDVIKKRLQVQGFKEEARAEFGVVRTYTGLRHCFTSIVKEEGILGLYKGLSPSLLKSGIVAASNFLIYDQVCELLKLRHSRR